MKRLIILVLLLLMPGILSQPAFADNNTPADGPWEKYSISLGGFVSAIDSNLRVGTKNLAVAVNLEDLLGLDSQQWVFRVDGTWRFSENRRHRFDLTWFSYRRDSSKRILNDIEVEPPDGSSIIIPADTVVEGKFDLDLYKGSYSYSFFQDDRVDLGVGLGLYVMPVKSGLKAAGLVDVSESANFTAPLPVLDLRADFAITPKWFLRLSSGFFYLKYGDFKGSLVSTSTRLEYNPWKNVGLGLGIESFRLNLEAEGKDYPEIDFNGAIGFNYIGMELYTRVFF